MRKSILSAVAGVTFLLGIAACSEENKYDSSVVTDIQLYLDDTETCRPAGIPDTHLHR